MSGLYNDLGETGRLYRLARLLDLTSGVLMAATGLYLSYAYAGILSVETRTITLFLAMLCAGWILYPKGERATWPASYLVRIRGTILRTIYRLTWPPVRSFLSNFRILTINR